MSEAMLKADSAATRAVHKRRLPSAPSGRTTALGRAVTKIAAERDEAWERLSRSETRLAHLTDAQRLAGVGHWTLDLVQGGAYWSEELYRICAVRPGDVEPVPQTLHSLVHPEDRPRAERRFAAALRRGHAYRCDFRIVRPDGQTRHLHSEALVECDPSGTPIHLFGTVQDVSRLRRVEARLKRNALQLRQKSERLALVNGELEDLTHAIAHDLKGPLRAVSSLTSWLQESLGEGADGEAQHYLSLMRSRVTRMHTLLEALLEYARAGRVSRPSTVDTAALLHEIAVRAEFQGRLELTFTSPMPSFRADRGGLEQVLLELIDNAVRHHYGFPARVQVDVAEQGDCLEFIVSDDGPGIAPEYHEKVFGMFQTLERRDDHERPGIGLSLVRKLVLLAGGDISLDSSPRRGTAVRFTWPRRLPVD